MNEEPLFYSLLPLLKASTRPKSVTSIHTYFLKSGFLTTIHTANHLLNSYLRCSMLAEAQNLFDEMPDPNVVSWTSLMAGHIGGGRPDQALGLFHQMARAGVWPNSFAVATAINACSHLATHPIGTQLHAHALTLGLHSDLVISTALISMYAKSNDLPSARHVFDTMPERNVISWGSMVSAYAQAGLAHEALALFAGFLVGPEAHLRPNHFMLSSVVNVCAAAGRLGHGKSTHGAVIRRGHEENNVIAGALIDMYAKCGSVEYAYRVFGRMRNPSLVPCTSMIVSAAKYGQVQLALSLFDEMAGRGVRPNSVTLVGVLHACSHAGLVETGLKYLDSMKRLHGVEPSLKHYTCAVDMLGRAGRLDEAFELAQKIRPVGDDDGLMLWSALLSAGRTHGRLDVAVEAGKRLAEFNRDVAGAYVAMSNAYVSAGRVEGAVWVRSEMRRRGHRKEPGCSWVEIRDVVYPFYAGKVDTCPRGREVVALLRELEGRCGGKGWGLNEVEVEGEEAGVIVRVHSEMLALGFGLLSIGEGMTIRVMKNLRMCGDCHEKFKMISGVVGRDFLVRDLNRFHHFRDGACICGDYW